MCNRLRRLILAAMVLAILLEVPPKASADEIPEDVVRAAEVGDMTMLRDFFKKSNSTDQVINTRINPQNCTKCTSKLIMNDTLLTVVVKNRQSFAVGFLLDQGADVLVKNAENETALSYAARLTETRKGVKIAKLLLGRSKANVNWEQKDGCIPLLLAVSSTSSEFQMEMIDLLIEAGSNIRAFCNKNETVLQIAARNGNSTIIRRFIDEGLDVDDNDAAVGQTALYIAAMKGYNETVASLLRWDADVNHLTKENRSALAIALLNGKVGIAKQLILAGADVSLRNMYPTLNVAARVGNEYPFEGMYYCRHSGEVENLYSKFATEVENTHSSTMIGYAVESEFDDIVPLMLQHGADVNATGLEGGNALFWAARRGDNKTVSLLLNWSVDVNLPIVNGCTPLMAAAAFGHSGVVKMLLEKGANVSTVAVADDNIVLDYPALWLAIFNGYLDIVKMLVDAGATINNMFDCGSYFVDEDGRGKIDDKNNSPYNETEMFNVILGSADQEIQDFLQDRYIPFSVDIRKAIRVGDVEKLRKYLSSAEGRGKINASTPINGTLLIMACRYGQVELVKLFIENGADVLQKDVNGETPLSTACERQWPNTLQIVELLLNRSTADLNWKSQSYTPLLKAISKKLDEDVIKVLVTAGADVNIVTDEYGNSALHLAVANGLTNSVALLLNNHANVNLENKDGQTPLLSCTESTRCKTETLKLMLDAGADLSIENSDNQKALEFYLTSPFEDVSDQVAVLLRYGALSHIENVTAAGLLTSAVKLGETDLCNLLLQYGVDVNGQDEYGVSSLMSAVSFAKLDLAEMLIEKGANCLQRNSDNETALSIAARLPSEIAAEMAKLLLNCTTGNVNWQLPDGFTALITATNTTTYTTYLKNLLLQSASKHRLSEASETLIETADSVSDRSALVEQLLNSNADVTMTDQNGFCALDYASFNGYNETVALLIKHGANVNHQTKSNGWTALMFASSNGHSYVVQQLIDAGAAVNTTSKRNETALLIAIQHGHENILEQLLKRRASLENALPVASEYGRTKIVDHLLELKLNVNKRSSTSEHLSPLMLASSNGHVEIVKRLLAAGAVIEAKSIYNTTALQFAAQNGHANVVELLLNKSANPSNANSTGETALILAAKNDHANVVAIFVKFGVDVNTKDSQGWSSLAWAASSGNLNLVRTLVESGANIFAKDNAGNTALMLAAKSSPFAVVDFFLSKSANMPNTVSTVEAALLLATKNNRVDVVTTIVKKYGIDVNSKDSQGWTPLIWASSIGNVTLARTLLDMGADISSKDNQGNTALMISAKNSSAGLVQLLVQRGPASYLDMTNNENNTALMYMTCCARNANIYKLLLDKEASFKLKNVYGRTAFLEAVFNGQLDVVKSFLSWPTTKTAMNLEDRDNDGNTAFMIAAKRGYFDLMKFLHESGANEKVLDRTGKTILMWAASNNRYDIASKVLAIQKDKRSVDTQNSQGDCALGMAAMAGNVRIVQLLILYVASQDLANFNGDTPLLLAAGSNNSKDVVQTLLKYRAYVHVTNARGNNALMIAAAVGDLKTIDVFLSRGVDFRTSNNAGETALFLAASNGKLQVVETLIAKGAPVNTARNDGTTPLIAAAINNFNEVVKYLLQKGANVNAEANGATALCYVAKTDNIALVQLLVENGASVNAADKKTGQTPLMFALTNERREIAAFLMKSNANVNAQDIVQGESALTIASANGDLESVQLLFKHGADVRLSNNSGDGALAISAAYGYLDLVKFLVAEGANVNARNIKGRTPLMNAAEGGWTDVVLFLLKKGADILAEDEDQITSVLLASWNGHMDLAETLIQNGAKRAGCTLCFFYL